MLQRFFKKSSLCVGVCVGVEENNKMIKDGHL